MKIRAKKHLGQHFLNDENIAKKIVDSLSWQGYDQALEIGPGMGVLTKYLLADKKNISVVEIDNESVEYLRNNYQILHSNFKIYEEDFLNMNLKSKLETEFAILGNFPYNISSQIIFKTLEERQLVPELVGMFQKEVAERIAATKGSKIYGILSVLTQAYYKVEYLFTVSESVFTPPPKVKSGVIRMKRYREKLEVDDHKFFQIVKTAFSQRRKTLRNALKSMQIPEQIINDEIFNLRAEQLTVQDFIEITKKMSE